MPVYYWFKIFETNDLNYLIINGKQSQQQLIEKWNSIYDEFITKFGLDENFIEHFLQRKKIILLELDYAVTKKASSAFKLELEQNKLKEINPVQEVQGNYMDLVVQISKELGYQINEKKTSVYKFYSYLKMLKNGK